MRWLRQNWVEIFLSLVVLISLVAIFSGLMSGCATPVPGRSAGADEEGAPAVQDVRWSEAPDTRTPIGAVPWCDDQHGHSSVYPCKWDTRERPAVGWDAQAAPVAVFVRRSVGCAPLIGRVKISEDDSVAWACYFAPGT